MFYAFCSRNIPAAPKCGVYISQQIRYSTFPPARSSTVIFWTEIRCLRKIYVAPGLKSSLQTSQGCTDELVDRYKIAIPQLAIDIFPLYVGFYILYHQQEFYLKFELRVIQPVSYSAACVLFYSLCLILQPVSYSTACVLFYSLCLILQHVSYSTACVLFYSLCLILQPVSYSKQKLLTLREILMVSNFVFVNFNHFLCCVLFVCHLSMFCAHYCLCLWVFHS